MDLLLFFKKKVGDFSGYFFRKAGSSMSSISIVLFLLLSPATIRIFEGLTPNDLARNLTQVLLAAPSTGGEVKRIFKELL